MSSFGSTENLRETMTPGKKRKPRCPPLKNQRGAGELDNYIENPKVIYEYEGGPLSLFLVCDQSDPGYKSDAMRSTVLEECKEHPIFKDHGVNPVLDAVVWQTVELFEVCEDCDKCNADVCPRPLDIEKGSGFRLSETLEGWFIDLAKCPPNVKVIDLDKEGKLMPCAPGVCQECAVDHVPEQPHNQQSLYYQYKFYQKNGRWPTWEDAMRHCSPEMQELWRDSLKKQGVML